MSNISTIKFLDGTTRKGVVQDQHFLLNEHYGTYQGHKLIYRGAYWLEYKPKY